MLVHNVILISTRLHILSSKMLLWRFLVQKICFQNCPVYNERPNRTCRDFYLWWLYAATLRHIYGLCLLVLKFGFYKTEMF